eukprot:g24685.t1
MPGYGETKRRRPSNSRGRSAGREEKRHKGKKEKKEKKARDDERSRKQARRSRSRDVEEAPEPTKAEAGPEADSAHSAGEKTKAAWREEMERVPADAESDGEVPHGTVAVEDDEDADRKVQESRARREALMAKWPFPKLYCCCRTHQSPRQSPLFASVSVMGCKGSKTVAKSEQAAPAQPSTLLETPIVDKGPAVPVEEAPATPSPAPEKRKDKLTTRSCAI